MSRPYLHQNELVFLINLRNAISETVVYLSGSDSVVNFFENAEFISKCFHLFKLKPLTVSYVQEFDLENLDQYGLFIKSQFSRDRTEVLNAFERCKIFADVFQKTLNGNLKEIRELRLNELERTVFNACLTVRIKATERSSALASKFLNDYLQDYQSNRLYDPKKNIFQPNFHFEKFMNLLKEYVPRFGFHRLILSPEPSLSEKIEYGESTLSQFKYLEYFLLMENRGYIRVVSVQPIKLMMFFPYQFVIDVLRTPTEILALENSWIAYGSVCLNTQTGHAFNGGIKCVLDMEQLSFQFLKTLLQNPEKKFDVAQLEDILYKQNKNPSADSKQTKTRLQDLSKGIRKKLKMDSLDSQASIFGSGDTFWLGAVPTRK